MSKTRNRASYIKTSKKSSLIKYFVNYQKTYSSRKRKKQLREKRLGRLKNTHFPKNTISSTHIAMPLQLRNKATKLSNNKKIDKKSIFPVLYLNCLKKISVHRFPL